MLVTFDSLFEIYPDKLCKGAVVGYRKPDGTPLEFPCTLETGDAVKDTKGRWTASALGLKPVVAEYLDSLRNTEAREAWIGDGFCKDPDAWDAVENATLECVRFVDDVTEIGDYAFGNCTGLTSVTIPVNVTKIGNGAFEGCTGLTSITIPAGVTQIESNAFDYCTGIESFNVDENNRVYTSVDGVLMNKEKTAIIRYPIGKSGSGYVVPDGVTHIADHAFSGCDSLSSVTILEGVTSIGKDAFWGCSGLTSITIPESVTSIGDGAFAECTGLTNIRIPSSVTSIGHNVFEVCTVVKVHGDGNIRRFYGCGYEVLQVYGVRILSRAGGNLQNHGGLLFVCGLYDRLDHLHVVYVESADGIMTLVCFFEHFFRCN